MKKPALILLSLLLAPCPLFSQTKIKVLRDISYRNIAIEDNQVPNFILASGRFYIDTWSYKLENYNKGTVKIESYSGVIVEGTFNYDFVYSAGSHSIPGIAALFPAVQSIKRIEFFDRAGHIFFEDTFENIPLFKPTIVKTTNNSFVVPRGNTYISEDGAKTWNLVRR